MSTGLLGFESVQERQGGVGSYLSPSRLNCWLRCPLAFRFTYIDGIRQPTTPSLFLGHVVHGAMETLYRHRQLGVILPSDEITKRMLEGWGHAVDEEGMQFDDVGEEQGLQKQAVDLVVAYIRQMPADEPKPLAVEVAVEAPLIDPLTGEDLGLPLVGVMDLVLDDADGPLVCDFKTSARSGEPLETAHEVQLTSYSWLFRHSQGHDEGGLEIRSLVKTKTPKIEIHRYAARTDTHFRRFFAVAHEFIDALASGRFNYRPGFACGMCDHRSTHCVRWAG
jgi:putative RecB family exonuclease